ncbi:addiction module antidote protein, HigA family [Sphingomonas koreensis]|nr:addiction module antidote protein, HigA family [Sphingomonas koreensis]
MHPSLAVHPGIWLKEEIVAPHGVTIIRLADAFGMSRQAISGLLAGRAALTADMAIRFEKAFGISADTLLTMQTAFDLAKARSHADRIKVGRVLKAA